MAGGEPKFSWGSHMLMAVLNRGGGSRPQCSTPDHHSSPGHGPETCSPSSGNGGSGRPPVITSCEWPTGEKAVVACRPGQVTTCRSIPATRQNHRHVAKATTSLLLPPILLLLVVVWWFGIHCKDPLFLLSCVRWQGNMTLADRWGTTGVPASLLHWWQRWSDWRNNPTTSQVGLKHVCIPFMRVPVQFKERKLVGSHSM